jgi:hypothetical protein
MSVDVAGPSSSGDSPRPPFLTEFVNHIREIFPRAVVYQVSKEEPLLRGRQFWLIDLRRH